jgi:organic radical activating enzyme
MANMNHPDRNQVRLDMLEGKSNPVCARCHLMQDQGIKSRRDRIMDSWRHDPSIRERILDVIQSTQSDGTIQVGYLDRIDIKFTGNSCNLKCYTCHPGSSSSLGVEAVQMGLKPDGYKPVSNPFLEMSSTMTDQFWSDLELMFPHTHILNFTGGEPFMLDSYWEMIDRAIQVGAAAQMELHLSSNMTVMKWGRRSVIDYFKQFRAVRLQASVDGFGAHNDYIRYPSEFQKVIDNIKRVQDETTNVHVVGSTTVSALSVGSLPTLHRYLSDNGIDHTYNNVLWQPSYQRVEWLPDSVKRGYLDGLFQGKTEYSDIIKLLERPEDLRMHKQLLVRCLSLDKHRGTNAVTLWPEFLW